MNLPTDDASMLLYGVLIGIVISIVVSVVMLYINLRNYPELSDPDLKQEIKALQDKIQLLRRGK